MLNVMLDLLITLEIYIICHLYWYTVHYKNNTSARRVPRQLRLNVYVLWQLPGHKY